MTTTTERTPLLQEQEQEQEQEQQEQEQEQQEQEQEQEQEQQQKQQQQQQGIHQLIHRIRFDLLTLIDTPLSTEQLTSPAITFSITRPLELTYLQLENQAIIFALLVNRVQFITDSTHALTLHSVNATRASLCEILATNILRRVHQSDLRKNMSGKAKQSTTQQHHYTVNQKLTPEEEEACLLKSANVLATAFSLFQGAPPQVVHSLQADWGTKDTKNVLSRQSNALEMAIVSEAKQFIRSPACQRVIDAIWTGKIVYTSTALVDIVSDRYKHRPVSLYNPRNAPLLNHYRLAVPRNRAALEYFHYGVLMVSYVGTLQTRQLARMNAVEIWFNIFTVGFAVDKLGSILEHGWLVFIANLWNGFDAAFILGHAVYLALRITGLVYLSHYELKSHWLNEQSHQVLSCLAILIFPRLAFITLSDNILILSLRSMLSDFLFLMLLGAWCFLGFGYALYSLQRGKQEFGEDSPYSLSQIAIWMVYIFFGLDATGISNAHEFHRILGPAIFIIYACLSNTLLVTVMVSILSKIFSDISNDSIAETLYRKAVLTFEGVKSDALFSFQPPFNIPAMMILIPLKPFLTPRKFHTVVVFLCRMFGCPVLLTISFFERYVVGPFDKDRNTVGDSLKLTVANSLGGLALNPFNAIMMKGNGAPPSSGRRRTTMSKMSSRISRNLRKFGGLAVINACFDYEPYPPVQNEADAQLAEDQLAVIRERSKVTFDPNKRLPEEPTDFDHSTVRNKTDLLNQSPGQASSRKPTCGSPDLENGTHRRRSTVGPATGSVGDELKDCASSSHGRGFGVIGAAAAAAAAPARELTTLEKLFLPHAGMVSTFVGGPVPTQESDEMTPVAGAAIFPAPVATGSSGRSAESDSESDSSTIEEQRGEVRPGSSSQQRGRPAAQSSGSTTLATTTTTTRPATLFLDPPRTSLGGNHKPASIIQDEFEEDRLARRQRRHRHRRNPLTTTSPDAQSVLHLATRSSSHSLHDPDLLSDDDEDDDDDDGESGNVRAHAHRHLSDGKVVLVSLPELQSLMQTQFDALEARLVRALAARGIPSPASNPPPPPLTRVGSASTPASRPADLLD